MKLYTFFQNENQVVYATVTNGKTFFFYSGFATVEEAKKATLALHVRLKKQQFPRTPTSLLECEVEMTLSNGEWSEIE